jgi:hypothetical protein
MNEENFESELRLALRREDPPAGFAAKILAQTVEAAPVRAEVIRLPVWRRPAAWALAAGLALAAIVPSAVTEYQRKREARALEARRELLTALEVTRKQLQRTRDRIQRNTRHIL